MTDNNQNHSSFCSGVSQDFFRQLDIQLLVHELKGPLSVIENNNRMLLEWQNRYGRLNEFQETVLKRCLRCTARLNNITQSILEVGSSDTGCFKLSRVDVVHFLTEILMDLLKTEIDKPVDAPSSGVDAIEQRYAYLLANGIFLDISQNVQGLVLLQDESKFGHILNNLVRNALQYKTSRVVIRVALIPSYLEISVHDDGNGIAPEERSALFKCYNQIKAYKRGPRKKGHGLGLASSRILARRLGGDVTIDTQCRSGSRFVLKLPLNVDDPTCR